MRYIKLDEKKVCGDCGDVETDMAVQYWKSGHEIPTCSKCLQDLIFSIGDSH